MYSPMVTAGPWMSRSPGLASVWALVLVQVMTGAGLPLARHSRVREEPSLTVYWPKQRQFGNLAEKYNICISDLSAAEAQLWRG